MYTTLVLITIVPGEHGPSITFPLKSYWDFVTKNAGGTLSLSLGASSVCLQNDNTQFSVEDSTVGIYVPLPLHLELRCHGTVSPSNNTCVIDVDGKRLVHI